MSDGVFNIARGKVAYYTDDALGLSGANSRIVLVALEAVEADDVLNNYDDLAALLGAAGNTEATSTGYSRIEIAAAGVTTTVDDTANSVKSVADADAVWTAISQATTEQWVKLVICWDGDNAAGTDGDIIPLTYHDFVITPNGGNITADLDQTLGFYTAI